MSKTILHKPLNLLTTWCEKKSKESFSDIIFYTKEKFDELENKRKVFNRLFPINKEGGFYMNQKIWNCYLIASLNAMRLNPYFMEELYENISFSKEANIFKTKVFYTFPDWEKVTVSIKDLKNQKEETKKNFNIKDIETLVVEVLNKIVIKWDIDKLIDDDKCKYNFDYRDKKRIIFSRDFIQEIKEQIISCDWEYYDILEKQKEYKSVDAPIWYKILEALYTQKTTKKWDRKQIIWWYSRDVFRKMMSKNKWDLLNYTFSNSFDKKSTLDILKDFNIKKYIITTAIWSSINYQNMTPFFSYWDYKMSDWHAYSIVWFNDEKEEIEIVNPWDNNKSMFFTKDDFFKLFSNIAIAKRK